MRSAGGQAWGVLRDGAAHLSPWLKRCWPQAASAQQGRPPWGRHASRGGRAGQGCSTLQYPAHLLEAKKPCAAWLSVSSPPLNRKWMGAASWMSRLATIVRATSSRMATQEPQSDAPAGAATPGGRPGRACSNPAAGVANAHILHSFGGGSSSPGWLRGRAAPAPTASAAATTASKHAPPHA